MAVTRVAALAASALCSLGSMLAPVEVLAVEPSRGELLCLAKAIYFEARGEPEQGRLAVGRVILNRASSGKYPSTICGVVYQNAQKVNACQFSFACDRIPDRITEQDLWAEIQKEAEALLACSTACAENGKATQEALWTSTHYHADYVSPKWARRLKKTGAVGRHLFYVAEST